MESQLKTFYRWLNGRDVREIREKQVFNFIKHLYSIKSQFNKPLKQSSINSVTITIKSFFKYLYNSEYILTNPAEEIYVKKDTSGKEKRIFTVDEISAFLDVIPVDDEDAMRDRAYFELMYSSGLRAEELSNLELDSIYFDKRMIIIKLGKGKKDRYIPFSETALKFLVRYVSVGRKYHLKNIHNENEKKYLFLSVKGKIKHSMISKRFKKYLKTCELDKKGFSLHSVRHTTATHLLEAGASIRYVQELLGHEDIKTTQGYARPSIENIKRIYKMYHPKENELYEEVTGEYLSRLRGLKEKSIKNYQKKKLCLKK